MLKRNKSFKNIYKSLVKPGFVISGASGGAVTGGGDEMDPLGQQISVASLSVSSSRRPSAVTDVSVSTYSPKYKKFLCFVELKCFFKFS